MVKDIFGEDRPDEEYWPLQRPDDEVEDKDEDEDEDEDEDDSNTSGIDSVDPQDLDWGDEEVLSEDVPSPWLDSEPLDEGELEDELRLRDLPSSDPFFVSREAAAVFKHKLLETYFPKFAGKAGSTEVDGRLVYVDTHAGRGQYDDGQPGSPLLIAQHVANMGLRRIDCFFIEADRENEAKLRMVLQEHMPAEANWRCRRGVASEHLAEALLFAGQSPLFVFADPYGFGPTFQEVAAVLNRPHVGWGSSKTEVLLNFMASAVARVGGYLKIPPSKQRISSLRSADAAMGGDYWRAMYLEHTQGGVTTEAAVRLIAEEYGRRMASATGCLVSLAPVRTRADNQVLYWLVHFTRHPDGRFWIQHSAGRAGAAWRRHLAPPPEAEDTLFQVDELDPFPAEEARRAQQWEAEIERSAEQVLLSRRSIDVQRDLPELYGSALGEAWSTHLLRGLKALNTRGLLTPKPTSQRLERYSGGPPATAT